MLLQKYRLFSLLLLILTPVTYAGEKKQEMNNFVGTWAAVTESIYLGSATSIPESITWDHPKLLDRKSIIKITGQEGHRFWGVRITDNQKPQPFIAVVDSSESTIVAVDQSGSIRGKVVNKNIFSYCYTQVPTRQNNQAYVECTVARRQFK